MDSPAPSITALANQLELRLLSILRDDPLLLSPNERTKSVFIIAMLAKGSSSDEDSTRDLMLSILEKMILPPEQNKNDKGVIILMLFQRILGKFNSMDERVLNDSQQVDDMLAERYLANLQTYTVVLKLIDEPASLNADGIEDYKEFVDSTLTKTIFPDTEAMRFTMDLHGYSDVLNEYLSERERVKGILNELS